MKRENRPQRVITGKLNCYYLALAISDHFFKRRGEEEEKNRAGPETTQNKLSILSSSGSPTGKTVTRNYFS